MLVRSLVWLCALITRMAVFMSHHGSTRVRLQVRKSLGPRCLGLKFHIEFFPI